MPLLDSALLKIERGREHAVAVKQAVDLWLGTDAYTISREKDAETGDTVRRAQIKRQPPPEIALLVGDAVHNFRSALDHTIYALAESQLGRLTPETKERLMFPIVGNVNRDGKPSPGETIFTNITTGKRDCLCGVPGPARDFIQREQPYHWNGDPDAFRFHWLWVLHDLDRIDKHRRLAVTTAWLDLPYATVPEGSRHRIRWSRGEGPVNDGDPLVTYAGAEKGVEAHFTRAVAINEGTTWTSDAYSCLCNVQQRVVYVISALSQITGLR